jgi:hypothetical protein
VRLVVRALVPGLVGMRAEHQRRLLALPGAEDGPAELRGLLAGQPQLGGVGGDVELVAPQLEGVVVEPLGELSLGAWLGGALRLLLLAPLATLVARAVNARVRALA